MMDWDRITQTGARTPGVRAVPGPILRYRCDLCFQTQSWNSTVGLLIRRMVTNWTSMLRMPGASLSDWRPGRSHLTCTPPSRTGENPPYGMIEGIVETSASFEARSAPRSYSTAGGRPRGRFLPRQACPERSEGSFLVLIRSFDAQDARGAHFEH